MGVSVRITVEFTGSGRPLEATTRSLRLRLGIPSRRAAGALIHIIITGKFEFVGAAGGDTGEPCSG
eukprot:875311-Rhodomonas_salina.1